jgi:hypothetical protein
MLVFGRSQGMEPISRAQVTQLLQAWSRGDRTAEERLWPIIYAELKSMAEQRDAAGTRVSTPSRRTLWSMKFTCAWWIGRRRNGRAERTFFGMCARMMRQILVDHARARNYQKRGGGAVLDYGR